MRKYIFIFILIFLINLTGCQFNNNGVDISKLTIVKVIGIDYLPDENMVEVTIVSKEGKSGEAGKQSESAYILVSEGETIFEALKKFYFYSYKQPFWGHVEHIILGQDILMDDVEKHLDVFSREHLFRLHTYLYTVREGSAKDFILGVDQQASFISDRLDNLGHGSANISQAFYVQLHDFVTSLTEPNTAAFLPYLELVDMTESGDKENMKGKDIMMSGYAIFKGVSIYGYITSDEAVGFNLLTGKFKSRVFNVKDQEGDLITLESIESKTKIKPKISKDNVISFEVTVNMKTAIAEAESKVNIISDESLDLIQEQLNDVIKDQVEKSINYAQSNKLDIFSIWRKVYQKYPVKWEKHAETWQDEFSDVQIYVKSEAIVDRSYLLKNPMSYGEDIIR